MEKKELKSLFWREAATGGLILGLSLVILYFIDYAFALGYAKGGGVITNGLFFVLIAVGLTIYGKRLAGMRGGIGFTYGQAIGFSVALLMFAGIIAGLGQFVLQTYIDPEYYDALFEYTLLQSGIGEDKIDTFLKARDSGITNNPIYMVIGSSIGTVLMGGLLSLFTSIFVKKSANPFAEEAAEIEAEFIDEKEEETAEIEEKDEDKK